MEIEFGLTPQDMPAFWRYHPQAKKELVQPLLRAHWLRVLIDSILHFGLFIFIFYQVSQSLVTSSGIALLLFLAMIWIRWYEARRTSRWYEDPREHWRFATQRLTISPDGVKTVSAYQEITYRWKVVWAIDATKDYVFFYNSTLPALILPRHAFRDASHVEEFLDLARDYQQGSKETTITTDLRPRSTAFFKPDDS